jgi:regulatory protein
VVGSGRSLSGGRVETSGVDDDDALEPGGRSVSSGADEREVTRARNIVLFRLSRSAKTHKELLDVLVRKGIDPAVADAVLQDLERVGLVNDAEYSQNFVANRRRSRHLASSAIGRELARKGIARELVEESVGEVGPDDDYATALEFARGKVGSLLARSGDDPGGRAAVVRKIAERLCRRGHRPGQAFQAAKQAVKEAASEF